MFSGTAESFDIYRGGAKIATAGSSARSFVDMAVVPNTIYLYTIRSVHSSTSSAASNADLATTIMFTDDPLVAGTTEAKAAHINELRTAVNAMRQAAGLPAATFTGTINSAATIAAVHVEELGTFLNQARTALGFPATAFPEDRLPVWRSERWISARFGEVRNEPARPSFPDGAPFLTGGMSAQQTSSSTTGTYAYDGSGNITAIGSDQYHYDSFGRLKSGASLVRVVPSKTKPVQVIVGILHGGKRARVTVTQEAGGVVRGGCTLALR